MDDFLKPLFNQLQEHYFQIMFEKIKEKPALLESFTGFLLSPEKIIIYLGKHHLGIEYIGPERIEKLKPEISFEYEFLDYTNSDNLLEEIVGFKSDATINFEIPLLEYSEELYFPTNRGLDKLVDLNWNFDAQNYIMSFNCTFPIPVVNRSSRIINSFFFDANDNGLITRHIKWLELIPINLLDDGETYRLDFSLGQFTKNVEHDIYFVYPIPSEFKYSKLVKINRFVELFGDKNKTEPEITQFLSKEENEFILSMFFSAKSIHPEVLCEWQSENRDSIKPDFLIKRPNGFCDIVEFKLPYMQGSTTVGKQNRETFSSKINSYVAQTRTYNNYFDDPNNRKWVEETHGLKVHKPKRFLIIGRRSDFKNEEWREIVADYTNLEIFTYDDLVDGVVVQFYKK